MDFLTNKRILLISPEPWDHIPVSKHHYAKKLAAAGNTVYFLNPPAKNNFIHQEANVHVVSYKTIRGINRMPSFFRTLLTKIMIGRIEHLCGGSFDIVWTFDAFRFQNLKLFNVQLRIYHAVDIHIAPLESELATSADLILSVSELIRQRFEKYNKPNLKINHGLADHFIDITIPTKSDNPKSETNVRIGYVGNLDNWCIDEKTLLTIVKNNPNVNFHFVGPYKSDSPLATKLLALPNCRLAGRVPTEKLPEIFQEIDMFLMCYKGSERDVNSNHHKILEFIATGKPSVINYTDEYDQHRDLVIMANTNDELPDLFQNALNNLGHFNESSLAERRKEFARANTYHSHIKRIDSIAARIVSEK